MIDNPLVSIVVPVYGTEHFLSKCVDSLIQQSYKNIEIILVDDESPDRCPEICDDYRRKDSRITVVHQKNKGVSGARNTGLQTAAGDYMMFVDSDDLLYPDAVQTLLGDAQDHSADIVSGTKVLYSDSGKSNNTGDDGELFVYRDEEPLVLSLDGNRQTNALHAKIFKKEIIEGLSFTEGKNINEDGFFLFQCFVKKPVYVQHNHLAYQYNYREDSSSKQRFSDKYFSMLYFCEQKLKIVSELYPQYIDKAYNMQVRTNLLFLDLLCQTVDPKYKDTQSACIRTVRRLYSYFRPVNKHQKQLAAIVRYGFYPLYKCIVRAKYHR